MFAIQSPTMDTSNVTTSPSDRPTASTSLPTPKPTKQPTVVESLVIPGPMLTSGLLVCGESYSDATMNCWTNLKCPTGAVS